MARVSTYLHFPGTTEQAFLFYQKTFKTPFNTYSGGKIARFGDMPPAPGQPAMDEVERQAVLHIELATLGDHVLMGTDALPSMGFAHRAGNHCSINLQPDTRDHADALFASLSEGGSQIVAMTDMFWGAYYGSFTDAFGVQWMINCDSKA